MVHRKLAIIRRRVFTALSVLSLLLCVATLAFWLRSYWLGDTVDYVADASERLRWWCIVSVRGRIGLHFHDYDDRSAGKLNDRTGSIGYFESGAEETGTTRDWVRPRTIGQSNSSASFLGFEYGIADTRPWSTFRGISIPHWFLALLFAILPALHLRGAIRSRRRHRAGRCPRCGYDLRATPDRCPECGTERVLATDEHR